MGSTLCNATVFYLDFCIGGAAECALGESHGLGGVTLADGEALARCGIACGTSSREPGILELHHTRGAALCHYRDAAAHSNVVTSLELLRGGWRAAQTANQISKQCARCMLRDREQEGVG